MLAEQSELIRRTEMGIVKLALTIPVLASLIPAQGHAQAHPHADWAVEKTFQIGGPGGWDYLTVDPRTHRLYVPRTTHTMVIDAESGKTVADIPGQKNAHGVALAPGAER